MPNNRRIAVKLELEWSYKRHTAVFAGLQQYAQERGWYAIVDELVEDTLTSRSKSVRYDGILARATEGLALGAARLKIPIVNVWKSSPASDRVPGVFADFRAAGQLRAEHLLSRGLHRFAALTTEGDRAEATEVAAFATTLGEAGYSVAAVQIPNSATASVETGRQAEQTIEAWMNDWKLPIGIYVGDVTTGRIVAQMCNNRYWRVPEDVAIIAGENEVTFCEELRPTLTSVEIGFERIGYEAARLLERLMDGESPPKEPILIPPQGLVVRESTDFLIAEDPVIAAALKFIAQNSHRSIGQSDVARAVGVETWTLQRRFQKRLKRPIAAEIRRVRIERAKRELVQGERTLKEIASLVGFGDPMRMCDVFRRELGVTPSQYRQERRTGARV